MPVSKIAGKGGSFSYNGTVIPFKKWSGKVTRKLADTTDSADYDVSSNMIHESQVPVSLTQEVTIEGNVDLNTTEAQIITQLYSGAAAVATILKHTPAVVYGHGNFDLSDFTCDQPVDDTVTFSATLKSNGVFVHGS
jgi:hypothetical protein